MTISDNIGPFNEATNLETDARIARQMCDTIALVQQYIDLACCTQQLFEKTISRTE